MATFNDVHDLHVISANVKQINNNNKNKIIIIIIIIIITTTTTTTTIIIIIIKIKIMVVCKSTQNRFPRLTYNYLSFKNTP